MHGGEEGLRALVGRDVVQPNVHHERVILVEPDHKVVTYVICVRHALKDAIQ